MQNVQKNEKKKHIAHLIELRVKSNNYGLVNCHSRVFSITSALLIYSQLIYSNCFSYLNFIVAHIFFCHSQLDVVVLDNIFFILSFFPRIRSEGELL